jgi:hypothetical protein
MKKSITYFFIALLLIPSISIASIEESYQEKSIIFENEKKVKIKVGDKIRFVINVQEDDDFFGETIVNANARIDNTSDQKVEAIYSISFNDKNGKLVECIQGSWDLNPDEDVNYSSGVIYADSESISMITN